MVPGAGAGCPVPLLARAAELRGPMHSSPTAVGYKLANTRGYLNSKSEALISPSLQILYHNFTE